MNFFDDVGVFFRKGVGLIVSCRGVKSLEKACSCDSLILTLPPILMAFNTPSLM